MLTSKISELDLSWINNIEVDDTEISKVVAMSTFTNKTAITENTKLLWLIRAINAVDLAALVGNEAPEDVTKLCEQAAFPLQNVKDIDVSKIPKPAEGTEIQCATVCLYPVRVEDGVRALANLKVDSNICVAAVAGGFPSGQYPLHTRLAEIYYVVASGAQEVDIVIDRSLVLRGLWSQLYEELVQMRRACGNTLLKVILSVTECGSWTNVYKASVVAMLAGADFIKSSTGKEAKSVTIHEGYVMCLAIKDFFTRTGIKVGLKPAGGIRTAEHAVSWMLMVREVLGEEWLTPRLFRIGTSGSSTMIPSVAQALTSLT